MAQHLTELSFYHSLGNWTVDCFKTSVECSAPIAQIIRKLHKLFSIKVGLSITQIFSYPHLFLIRVSITSSIKRHWSSTLPIYFDNPGNKHLNQTQIHHIDYFFYSEGNNLKPNIFFIFTLNSSQVVWSVEKFWTTLREWHLSKKLLPLQTSQK